MLTAEDFDAAESSKNEGILDVFLVFRTVRMRQKIRCSAADDLFRVSQRFFLICSRILHQPPRRLCYTIFAHGAVEETDAVEISADKPTVDL